MQLYGRFLSSIMSPSTTNVIRQAFLLSEFHKSDDTMCVSIYGKLFGKGSPGFNAFMSTYFKFLLPAIAVVFIVELISPSVVVYFVYASCICLVSILLALSLNRVVLMRLITSPGAKRPPVSPFSTHGMFIHRAFYIEVDQP